MDITSQEDHGRHDRMWRKASAGDHGRKVETSETEVCEPAQELVHRIHAHLARDPSQSMKILDMT